MFSYVLAVFASYIVLIFIFPMVKAGKLNSIASISAIHANLKITLRVEKYGGLLLNCSKSPLVVLCLKSQQLIILDFKLESVLQSIKKIKFYV